MSENSKIVDQSGKNYKTGNGDCTTKILLYHLKCKICGQPYVGKTVQMLSSRMCGHRSKYYELLSNNGGCSNGYFKPRHGPRYNAVHLLVVTQWKDQSIIERLKKRYENGRTSYEPECR